MLCSPRESKAYDRAVEESAQNLLKEEPYLIVESEDIYVLYLMQTQTTFVGWPTQFQTELLKDLSLVFDAQCTQIPPSFLLEYNTT